MSETDDKPALDINTSVPHLNVQWDFESGDLWIAEFGAGDLAGTKVSSSVKELSQIKWASLGGDKHFGVTLAKASFKVRKDAVWKYIIMCGVPKTGRRPRGRRYKFGECRLKWLIIGLVGACA